VDGSENGAISKPGGGREDGGGKTAVAGTGTAVMVMAAVPVRTAAGLIAAGVELSGDDGAGCCEPGAVSGVVAVSEGMDSSGGLLIVADGGGWTDEWDLAAR
jgi:hypothetical protein